MISPLRFLAVVYPVASLSFRTNSNARLAIGITWLVTLLSVRFLPCQTQRWCVNSKLRVWFEEGYSCCISNFLCIISYLKEGFQNPSKRVSSVNRGGRSGGGGGLLLSPQARKQKSKQGRGGEGHPLANKFCDWGFGVQPPSALLLFLWMLFLPFFTFTFHFLFSLFTLTFHFHFLFTFILFLWMSFCRSSPARFGSHTTSLRPILVSCHQQQYKTDDQQQYKTDDQQRSNYKQQVLIKLSI